MLVLGHRGAPGEFPENTLDSFAAALAAGADGVELDVRLTLDDMLAIRHEDRLDDSRSISTVTLADAQEIEPRMPVLDDALDVLRPGLCVVELKTQPVRNDRFAELVAAVLQRRWQRIVVSSFDPTLLRDMRSRLPSLRTALLVGVLAGEQQVDATIAEALDAGHAELHVHRHILTAGLSERLFAAASDTGLGLVGWTVNDEREAAALRDRGLAAVITDEPAKMVRAGLQA